MHLGVAPWCGESTPNLLLHFMHRSSTACCEICTHAGSMCCEFRSSTVSCNTIKGGMATHRIRELRERRGLSQRQLAESIGRTKSVVSRLEDGTTRLDLVVAANIAKVLDVSLAELLNIEGHDPGRVTGNGFAEDLSLYAPSPGDPWSALQSGSRYLYKAETAVLEKMGIAKGDVCVVDGSAEACAAVQPLSAVRVHLHHVDNLLRPVSLLRQFVPPQLLITNAHKNLPSIDMDTENAHVAGVVIEVLRRFPESRA